MATTPADRLARAGQPSLALPLAVTAAAAVVLIAVAVAVTRPAGEGSGENGAPENGASGGSSEQMQGG